MLMKVFNKGQVVLPVALRRALGIEVGDLVEVELDEAHKGVYIHPQAPGGLVRELAGSLHQYRAGKKFPTEQEINNAMRKGMKNDDTSS